MRDAGMFGLSRHRMWGTAAVMFAACWPLMLGGCSGEVLGEVSGRVTFQGEPLSEGVVIFRNRAKGVYMTAPIGAGGEYRVEMARGYGLPLGEYEVFVSPPVQDAPVGPALTPPKPIDLSKMPERYLRGETSGLRLRVERGKNRLDIAMQP